ncbi:MAG: alpha/beta hydrolase [Dehalococcoidia bacterium]|nr:alpha/beta hydrolase [Dehalococcoidia bacterium]
MPHLDLDDGPVDSLDGGEDSDGDGFRLYYEVHGPTPGSVPETPVLLAHGAGGNAMSWWQQVPALADRYPVITFDHRAFGRSPDIEDGPGRMAFGSDVRQLLDHLGVERVHFVGHSMGGRTAFGLLSRDPGRIVSLTYSGTNGGCLDDRYRELKASLEADGTLAGSLLKRALAEGYAEAHPEMRHLYMRIRSLNPSRGADFLKPTGRFVNYRGSTAQRLVDTGLPILWLVGEQDRVVHPDLIQISHELTPGSRFHVIAGAGHSAYFERPEEWNRTVRGFLDDVEERIAGR